MGFYKGERPVAEKKTFKPIADGVHKFAITEAEYEVTEKASRYVFELQIDDEGSEFNKSKVWVRLVVESDVYSPMATEIGQRLMDELSFAAGVEVEDDLSGFADFSDVAHRFIGQSVLARTEQREYNDKIYVDAKQFWTLSGEHIDGRPLPSLTRKASKPAAAPSPKKAVAKPVRPAF